MYKKSRLYKPAPIFSSGHSNFIPGNSFLSPFNPRYEVFLLFDFDCAADGDSCFDLYLFTGEQRINGSLYIFV